MKLPTPEQSQYNLEKMTKAEEDYWKEIERLQAECTHPNGIDPEDGCIDCGYYAK